MADPTTAETGCVHCNGFGIETWESWSDYPSWEEFKQYDGKDEKTIRFATNEAAQEWLDAYLDADYERRKASWEQRQAAAEPARQLFHQRKQCLVDAGLWKRDDESFVQGKHM